jgi:hypothetical protein
MSAKYCKNVHCQEKLDTRWPWELCGDCIRAIDREAAKLAQQQHDAWIAHQAAAQFQPMPERAPRQRTEHLGPAPRRSAAPAVMILLFLAALIGLSLLVFA